MTVDELALELAKTWRNALPEEALWPAVARRAQEILCAPALPAEPPPGFVRVGAVVWRDKDGAVIVEGGKNSPDAWWRTHRNDSDVFAIITADVPLPPAPAEITGVVE